MYSPVQYDENLCLASRARTQRRISLSDINKITWNGNPLSLEQPLQGQAVWPGLLSFHHGTNHTCLPLLPLKLSRTPVHDRRLVFGPMC